MPRCLLAVLALLGLWPCASRADSFDQTIAPILIRHCLDCHGSGATKGGLNLLTRKGALTGGRTGPALVPGKLKDSLLWQRVEADEMPPKKPLAAREKELLRRWITAGGAWGSDPIDPFRATTDKRGGFDWWSLQPLHKGTAPSPRQTGWVRQPLDAFILQRLEAKGLTPSPEADRRTLLRRLSFDLIGLPPTSEEVEAFVHDRDPLAYEKVVDRLLASPHYGEHWARHWLDVVRWGESDGFERDLPRSNAWPYRDWVIKALNRDLPYDEFVRWQLAGDRLHPDDPEALAATGFLVAGPHDIVVPASDRMKAAMRQDEMEDLVGTVGQTFLGLTVHCARCHDHKFDPISQKDYYRLVAALAGVGQGERPLPAPKPGQELARLQARLEQLNRQQDALENPIRARLLAEKRKKVPDLKPLAAWDFQTGLKDQRGMLDCTLQAGARQEARGLVVDGKTSYAASAPLAKDLREKTLEAWVHLGRLEQRGGGVLSVQTLNGNVFDAIVFGEQEPGRWMAGSEFFHRTRSFQGASETEAHREAVHFVMVYDSEGTIRAYRNGVPYGQPYRSAGLVTFKAGAAQVVFGLRHGPAGGNKMLEGVILKARLYDRALSAEEVAQSAGTFIAEADLVAQLSAEQRQQRERWSAERRRLAAKIQDLLPRTNGKVYAVVPGQPGPTHLLLRGSVDARGELLAPGGIAALGKQADFALKPDAPEADRRLALARWITDPTNPLFARVIVNRLWHYHLGTGLVDTPSDFGFNGGRPSHPELLDWLAGELIRHRWSLKAMHRVIVTSATYRQASRPRPEAQRSDADNRLYWRVAPRRLEAESLRDAMLLIAGHLDPTVGGPAYQDFRSYFFKGTQFYDPLDQVGDTFRRRTIYRMWARGGRNPFLDTFDCPDPSTTTPRRASTTTPLQALTLLNNAQVLSLAERTATRLRQEAGPDPERQLARLYALVHGRTPTAQEVALLKPFLARHGLTALCRVIFNSNEFLFVD